MRIIKLFLASSAELKEDREQVEILVYRKCKEWVPNKKIFLHLDNWEDFNNEMSQTRLQDRYNKTIKKCDIFIMLIYTKIGKYTLEEFKNAFGHFKETNRPFIYIYFKKIHTASLQNNEEEASLKKFEKLLKKLGHFKTVYKNIEDLTQQINYQLEKLYENKFRKLSKADFPPIISGTFSNIIKNKGKENKIFQDIKNSTIDINSSK